MFALPSKLVTMSSARYHAALKRAEHGSAVHKVDGRVKYHRPEPGEAILHATDIADADAFREVFAPLPRNSACHVLVSTEDGAPSLLLQRFAILFHTEIRVRKVLTRADGAVTLKYRCTRGTHATVASCLPPRVPNLPDCAPALPGTYRACKNREYLEFHHWHLHEGTSAVQRCKKWRQPPHDVGCEFSVSVTRLPTDEKVLIVRFPQGTAHHPQHHMLTAMDILESRAAIAGHAQTTTHTVQGPDYSIFLDVDQHKELHPDLRVLRDYLVGCNVGSTLVAQLLNGFAAELHPQFVANPAIRSAIPLVGYNTGYMPEDGRHAAFASGAPAPGGSLALLTRVALTAATAAGWRASRDEDDAPLPLATGDALSQLQLCRMYSSYRWSVDTTTVGQAMQHRREAVRGHVASWAHSLQELPRLVGQRYASMSLYVACPCAAGTGTVLCCGFA